MPASATNQKGTSTRWTLLALAMIVLVTSAIRWPLLGILFERDEGEYAYIAWRLDYGELPYRDWMDQKPPAIFWVYRLALALPMDPVRAAHFMGLLFAAASACALYFLARRFLSHPGALAAGILLAILSTDIKVLGQSANTELFMLLPLILAQIAFFSATENERRRTLFIVLCGVLTGFASAFKQVAAVNWLFLIALYPVFVPREQRVSGTVRFAIGSTFGAALVWGLISLYFFLRNGLPDFIFNVFTHNFHYIGAVSWDWRREAFLNLLSELARTESIVWLLAIGGLVTLCRARRWKWLLFLVGWGLSSAAGVSASGYYFAHYAQQLLPVLALMAILGAEAVFHWRWWSATVSAPIRAVILGLLLTVLPIIYLYPYLFKYSPVEATRTLYHHTLFSEMPELAKRLTAVTKPDDRVFIFGVEPELYFYARRASASRYIFLYPLYGRYPNVLEQQKAAAEEVARNRPAAVFSFPDEMLYLEGTEQYFTHWCEDYFGEHYGVHLYLGVDDHDRVHFISTPEQVATNTMKVIGAMFLRTSPSK